MADPITSFRELKAALKALPKPPRGTIRVYRGQNNDYPTLFPSGLRRSVRKQTVWLAYSHLVHRSLLPEPEQASQDVTQEMLKVWALWLHAVAQHYGPGSDYLDVSHSVEMALWFALNEYKTIPVDDVIGPAGPPDPSQDHPMAGEVARYSPWRQPGYLYVFDLPKWNGEIMEVGTVVDVADAPEIFSSSLRMRAQEACLVYCRGEKGAHLDMKTRLVPGTPLLVQRPMTGAAGLDRSVSELFPSPEKDPWYARLLSVPMTYAAEPAPPKLRRTIPVTVYSDESNKRYEEEVLFRDVVVSPPLLHRWVRQQAKTVKDLKLIAKAVPIILEAPVIFPYPPANSPAWHHGLLVSDLPDRCHTYNLDTALPDGEVDLTNVLFEFSPLERAGWARTVRENLPLDLVRGVWIHRTPGATEFDIGLIYQASIRKKATFARSRIFYDEALGELFWAPNPKLAPIPLRPGSDLTQEFGKPAIVALMLLRFLSPVMKAAPCPLLKVGMGGGQSKIFIACCRDVARLFRVGSGKQGDWFVLRDATKPAEPFTRAGDSGALEVTTRQEFYQIPLDDIRGPLQGQ